MFYGPVWVLRLPFLPPGEGGVLGDPKIASLFDLGMNLITFPTSYTFDFRIILKMDLS